MQGKSARLEARKKDQTDRRRLRTERQLTNIEISPIGSNYKEDLERSNYHLSSIKTSPTGVGRDTDGGMETEREDQSIPVKKGRDTKLRF